MYEVVLFVLLLIGVSITAGEPLPCGTLGFFLAGCACCGSGSDCDCCATTPASLTVDFGAGGWTDGTFPGCVGGACATIAGDWVVTEKPNSEAPFGLCHLRSFSNVYCALFTAELTIRAVIVKTGGDCFWRVTVTLLLPGITRGNEAVFESATTALASFNCTTMPVTLSKVSDAEYGFGAPGSNGCQGALPATITLDV